MISWSPLVQSGHRSLTSESSVLRKSIKSIFLVSPSGKYANLLEESEVPEDHKLILICGTVGLFNGVENEIHQGYIQTASKNASDWYNNDDPCDRAKLSIYSGFRLLFTPTAKSDKQYEFTVQHLMDMVNLLAAISMSTVEFGDDLISQEEEKIVRNIKTLTESEKQEMIRSLTK